MKSKLTHITHHEAYLYSLLEASSEIIVFLTAEGNITEFNSLAEKIFGLNKTCDIGKSFYSLYQNKQIQMPFSQVEFTALMKGDTSSIESTVLENNNKTFLLWGINDLSTYNLSASGFIITGRNITDKKNFETQLLSNRNQLETISACVPGNFYWKDTKLQYRGCNDSLLKMLGLNSVEDIMNKTDYDLWPEQAEALREHDTHVMNSKETVFFEEVVSQPGKKDKYFTVIKMPWLDAEGNVIGILGNSLDISELKNTQKELIKAKEAAEAANHAKTEFIANMSHDIRTPLSGIIGMSSLLKDALQNPKKKQYAEWVNQSGEQLLGLLNGILDIISADNLNENHVHEEVIDLHKCLTDIVELERPSTYSKGLDLRLELDEPIPKHIKTDGKKFHRILLNLLGNAIKFTKKGHVTIGAKLLDFENKLATIRFNVTDTGIGIEADQQDKVFDRFHRVTPSYKGVYEGHGVGLHIAATYTKLLGGHIKLESEPGVGTTFYFDLTFPVSDSADEPELAADSSALSISSGKQSAPPDTMELTTPKQKTTPLDPNSSRMLLVEDNIIALKLAESIVSSAACHVVSAPDGEQALELAKSQKFDLIITDIGLPGMSGIDLTRWIREWEVANKKSPTPIVGLTAHAKASAEPECLAAGMNDVFSKPITGNMVQSILTTFVNKDDKNAAPSVPTETTVSNSALGHDLPNTEDELFMLESFPLLDIDEAISIMGNIEMVRTILPMMMADETLADETLKDVADMEQAYHEQDWGNVERLAHKIKGGASSCGTIRMKYACQYLERYLKAGHKKQVEPLYHQCINVINETQEAVKRWLAKQDGAT